MIPSLTGEGEGEVKKTLPFSPINTQFSAQTWKQKLLGMSLGSTLTTWHIGRWPNSQGRWPLAMEDDKDGKLNEFSALTWKQKLLGMSHGSTLTTWHIGRWPHSHGRWHLAMKDGRIKKWISRLDMKTKVGRHVTKINIRALSIVIKVPSCFQITFDMFNEQVHSRPEGGPCFFNQYQLRF